jgi:hypothetical protein
MLVHRNKAKLNKHTSKCFTIFFISVITHQHYYVIPCDRIKKKSE